MVCETFSQHDSFVHRLDPRVRVVVAGAFSVLVAVSGSFTVPAVCMVLAVMAAGAAALPAKATLKRLAGVNLFILLLFATLPITEGGTALFRIGPLAYGREGTLHAGRIALKCNAIALALTALLSTMTTITLGHALGRLRVPQKLVHMLLFTVRYIEVLRHEYIRLARAMKIRGFRPGANFHTFRSVGYLLGMLLVKGFDRSQRVAAAMKCRGFRGRFYLLTVFSAAPRDAVFCAASFAVLSALVWLELA